MPVIASGGAGELEHLTQALQAGADAALCASIFHYGQHTIAEAKAHLAAAGIQCALSSAGDDATGTTMNELPLTETYGRLRELPGGRRCSGRRALGRGRVSWAAPCATSC